MPLSLMVGLLIGMLLLLLGSGIYVGAGLAGVGILGFEALLEFPDVIGTIIYNTLWSYTLFAVPLFMFMGWVVLYSGISSKLYRGVSKWTSIIPGGLLHSNIVSCSLFAAISGSSVATAGTLGAVAYSEQSARGYSRGLVTGSLAAGGTLGILIPPSITMIIYGAFVGASVGRLFIAGVIPGIILTILFISYIGVRTIITPSLAEPRKSITRRYFLDAILAFGDIWPILLLMLSILGGIYSGVMTPTEAAAISCFESLILAAIFGKLDFNMVKNAAISALETTAMIMFIMIGANIFGSVLAFLKIPAQISEMLAAMNLSPLIVWLGVAILYLIMGCLMDGVSMMLLTLPITFSLIVTTFGFDKIWFGVMITILVECGLITPPVGLNVYVIHGISGGTDIGEVFKGIVPFLICMLVAIALLTFVPDLVTYLPSIMYGK